MAESKYAPTRSIRIDTEVWDRAKRRARSEGVTISRVLSLLTEGYAKGMINLPRIQIVYDNPEK